MTVWHIALSAFAFAFMMFCLLSSSNEEASCYTDKPANVVMCVDLGVGHHSLMESFKH